MIVEFGHLALILSLGMACILAVIPMIGSFYGKLQWMQMGRSVAIGHFVFIAIAFAVLVDAFVNDDFTVKYVASHSNSLLPYYYKISAVWGGHEGSMLLWALILSAWTAVVAILSHNLPLVLSSRVLSILGIVSVGFALFLLLTSNPFERSYPFPPGEGNDLNPLLQDIGLILHPPLLYMGYVGFAVPFAFAVAALIGGQFDRAWARWTRPWTNTAWAFLTLGIMLGSWWAYYELGWGGWWFWDPVENASFMPWLAGTALVHSFSATEKRGVFLSWTLLLAIFAFSLSLLGTFLVRSGVLTSVHAFASDPTRGVFILAFLGVVVGGSLLLFAIRGPVIRNAAQYTGWSREMLLLVNNILLVSAMGMILIGTLYPLIADVLDWGKISVGPPYFNFFFVPLMVVLLLCLGLALLTRWKNTPARLLVEKAFPVVLVSLAVGSIMPVLFNEYYTVSAMLVWSLSCWVVFMSLQDLWKRLVSGRRERISLRRLPGSYWGMLTAHTGLAICALGVGLSEIYSVQHDLRVVAGDSFSVSGYRFAFEGVEVKQGQNYQASQGTIKVYKDGALISTLLPEKRQYFASGQVMTEADIDPGITRDIYVALGEPLSHEAWAVRLYVKPFVRCIWLGGLLIAFGGFVAAADKRYRKLKKRQVHIPPTVSEVRG